MMEYLGQLILNVGTIVAAVIALKLVIGKVFLDLEKYNTKTNERNAKLLNGCFKTVMEEFKGVIDEVTKQQNNVVKYDFSKDNESKNTFKD